MLAADARRPSSTRGPAPALPAAAPANRGPAIGKTFDTPVRSVEPAPGFTLRALDSASSPVRACSARPELLSANLRPLHALPALHIGSGPRGLPAELARCRGGERLQSDFAFFANASGCGIHPRHRPALPSRRRRHLMRGATCTPHRRAAGVPGGAVPCTATASSRSPPTRGENSVLRAVGRAARCGARRVRYLSLPRRRATTFRACLAAQHRLRPARFVLDLGYWRRALRRHAAAESISTCASPRDSPACPRGLPASIPLQQAAAPARCESRGGAGSSAEGLARASLILRGAPQSGRRQTPAPR